MWNLMHFPFESHNSLRDSIRTPVKLSIQASNLNRCLFANIRGKNETHTGNRIWAPGEGLFRKVSDDSGLKVWHATESRDNAVWFRHIFVSAVIAVQNRWMDPWWPRSVASCGAHFREWAAPGSLATVLTGQCRNAFKFSTYYHCRK
jgi:hypothetical protein